MCFQNNAVDYVRSYKTYSNSEAYRPSRLKSAHKSFIVWHVLAIAYYISSSFCESLQSQRTDRLVDLSHVFDNTTIYWVTEPRLHLDVTFNDTVPGTDNWYQKDEIFAATHGGTHLDSPCHFAKGRWDVADIPLEHLVVPGVVVDISSEVNGNPAVHLSTDHLLAWEREHGQIADGSLLLVSTGWAKFWPDPLTYSGTTERNVRELKYPSILGEAAKWLVANRKVVGVGIDVMSIDIPNAGNDSHIALSEANIYALENVNNIDLLPPTGAVVYVMPMKLRGASGAPCRIVAQIPRAVARSAAVCHVLCTNLCYIVAAVLFLVLLKL